jgi:hypothetical protein
MAAVTHRDRPSSGAELGRLLGTPASALAQDIVRSLVRQRQELRRGGATRATLEANRLAIVYWQQRQASALVAEHCR